MNRVTNKRGTLVLRDARSEELEAVARVTRDAYLEYEPFFPPEHWQTYLDNVMDVRSRLADSELIVAAVDGSVAGSVTFYPDGAGVAVEGWPPDWAVVRLLAVHPSYRGRGIGHALMEECVRRCRERHIKDLGLHTALIMKIARGMYERMGFQRAPELDFHPRPDTVVMAYRLRL